MPLQCSRSCYVPDDILTQIALELALVDPLGPPTHLASFLRVCKDIHSALNMDRNPGLYAQIFALKFDRRASNRRIGGHAAHSSNLAAQLRKNCISLKRIRRGDVLSQHLQDDLWTAYLMLLENDGKNAVQLLEYAEVDRLVDRYLRSRLWMDREHYSGWPPETTANALALWVYWMTLDTGRIMAMTSQQDDEMRRLILPYIICIVRYPFFHAPDIHFDFPIPTIFASASPTALVTPHGFWPIYRHPEAVRERIIHYGLEIDISAPLLSLGARLLFLTLTQRTPWEALPTWPRDREEALARGSQDVDPTQADIAELNANWAMTLYDRSSWDWRSRLTSEEGVLEDDGIWRTDLKSSSSLWDNEWSRLTSCIDPTRIATNSGPVYIPGTLSGLWKGRSTESDIPILQDFIDSETFPETYATVAPATRGHWPIYMRLREHHCISPEVPIPPGGSETSYDDGLCNAWFPTDVALHESNGTVRVQSTSTGFASMYETFVASRSNSHNESTCTVCVNKRRIEEDEITRRIHAEPVTPSSTKSSDRSDVPSTSSPRKIPTQRTENDMEHVREYMNKGIEAGMDIDEVLESELRPHMRMNESDEESNSSRHSSNGDSLTDTVCSGIQDIIVTGETLTRHGQAWGHFVYYGRVRPWDGLVAIVRQRNPPVDGGRARNVHIFRGYIIGGTNLVGSVRAWSHNAETVTREGPFVMTKI